MNKKVKTMLYALCALALSCTESSLYDPAIDEEVEVTGVIRFNAAVANAQAQATRSLFLETTFPTGSYPLGIYMMQGGSLTKPYDNQWGSDTGQYANLCGTLGVDDEGSYGWSAWTTNDGETALAPEGGLMFKEFTYARATADFYAYYPHAVADQPHSLTAIPFDATTQDDMLFATHKDYTVLQHLAGERVKLAFSHLYSLIEINIENTGEGNVTLGEPTINDLEEETTNYIYTQGTFDLATASGVKDPETVKAFVRPTQTGALTAKSGSYNTDLKIGATTTIYILVPPIYTEGVPTGEGNEVTNPVINFAVTIKETREVRSCSLPVPWLGAAQIDGYGLARGIKTTYQLNMMTDRITILSCNIAPWERFANAANNSGQGTGGGTGTGNWNGNDNSGTTDNPNNGSGGISNWDGNGNNPGNSGQGTGGGTGTGNWNGNDNSGTTDNPSNGSGGIGNWNGNGSNAGGNGQGSTGGADTGNWNGNDNSGTTDNPGNGSGSIGDWNGNGSNAGGNGQGTGGGIGTGNWTGNGNNTGNAGDNPGNGSGSIGDWNGNSGNAGGNGQGTGGGADIGNWTGNGNNTGNAGDGSGSSSGNIADWTGNGSNAGDNGQGTGGGTGTGSWNGNNNDNSGNTDDPTNGSGSIGDWDGNGSNAGGNGQGINGGAGTGNWNGNDNSATTEDPGNGSGNIGDWNTGNDSNAGSNGQGSTGGTGTGNWNTGNNNAEGVGTNNGSGNLDVEDWNTGGNETGGRNNGGNLTNEDWNTGTGATGGR